MAKIKKKKVKKLFAFLVPIILILGFVTSALFIFKPSDSKTVSPSFHVGGINEQGAYEKDDTTMYSDLFECKGLTIEPKFDSSVQYKVFFYRFDKSLISDMTTGVLSSSYTLVDNLAVKYARVLIIPELENDETIGFLDVYKFKKELTITVDKEQPEVVNYFQVKETGKEWRYSGASINTVDSTSYYVLEKINCEGVKQFVLVPRTDSILGDTEVNVVYKTKTGTFSSETKTINTENEFISIPSDVTEIYISVSQNDLFDIYAWA